MSWKFLDFFKNPRFPAKAASGGRSGMGEPIDQALVNQASGQAGNTVRDADVRMFGPMQPTLPIAPRGTPVRQFDYAFGQNVNVQVRYPEVVSFGALRSLADGLALLRSIIETCKDKTSSMPLDFRLKRVPGISEKKYKKANAEDKRITELKNFFEYPDKEHDFQSWMKAILEDHYVIDAACVEPILDKSGKLYALAPVDGATIQKLISAEGRTPAPDEPGYRQIIKGMPFINLTANELLYWQANFRPNHIYGYSKVEQSIVPIMISMRRELFLLSFYTDGNVPEGFLVCPENYGADAIKQLDDTLNSLLQGDLAARRRIIPVPGGAGVKFEWPKLQALKDELDDYLARELCAVFGVPPNPYVKQMNRGQEKTAVQEAEAEGLRPTKTWAERHISALIPRFWGWDDIEAAFMEDQGEDPLEQAQILQILSGNKQVLSVNECRDRLGEEGVDGGDEMGPAADPNADPNADGGAPEKKPQPGKSAASKKKLYALSPR